MLKRFPLRRIPSMRESGAIQAARLDAFESDLESIIDSAWRWEQRHQP